MSEPWIPACAGMTVFFARGVLIGSRLVPKASSEGWSVWGGNGAVIPAQAGIQKAPALPLVSNLLVVCPPGQ
ncbi:MAG TPA: hypothetical protein PK251_12870 [Candidatus Latescibacteria bacterium]|nr:hypothetical protein [Candidatus Latescibacterota bacterium]HPK75532.1 hypothetical protein [Candidatus Latescibacterota bacterium]